MSEPNTHDNDPCLAALLAWRQQLIASGEVSAGSFKEAHVRMVRNSGRTDVEEIRAMLPGAVAEHAEDMVRVLREACATEDAADDAAEDTGTDAAPYGEETAVIGTAPRPRGDDDGEGR